MGPGGGVTAGFDSWQNNSVSNEISEGLSQSDKVSVKQIAAATQVSGLKALQVNRSLLLHTGLSLNAE